MRSSSSSHVRTKIVALLAGLAALWTFAAWVTVRDGLNLLFVSTLTNDVGRPTEELVDALQEERRLSAVVLGGDNQLDALDESRVHTDEVVASWRERVDGRGVRLAASGRLEDAIDALGNQVTGLAAVRDEVDGAVDEPREAVDAYTGIIDSAFVVYGSLSSLDDQEIARQSSLLVSLTQARELLSREDALLSGALASRAGLSGDDLTELARLIGAQQFLYDRTASELSPDALAIYQAAAGSRELVELRRLESVVERVDPNELPSFNAEDWRNRVEPAQAVLREMELAAADQLLARATPVAAGVILRLVLAGGLGLIAVIAAVIVSITTARSLIRQLERLRDAARDLAANRLPRVVERLSSGETVDVAAEAPPLRFGDDEIGQVGQAFNAVQETAVQAAVQQAELRHGVRDVFLSLARRTQNLVHKQLSVVDGMERRETDADEMEELYRIDHLATRMRRNAENLIVLAGSTPGRVWRRPVPMVDVVRGAIAEVEDYQRVNLMPVQGGALEGRVAGDVIHLLAELIENAASFSPPYAKVSVAGQRVAHGFVIEIEDRGLGMPEADLATVNRQLAEPPDFSLADASRLGHYVVAKLAQRHGVRVHLRTSPYGGITAIVLVPKEIMLEVADDEPIAVSAVPAPPPTPSEGDSPRANGSGGKERAMGVVVVRQARPVESVPAPQPELPAPPPDGLPVRPKPDGNTRTPAGLPWRVRQASLPKQLLNEDNLGEEPAPRDPEQVRKAMRSYQLGTQRGRTDSGDDFEQHQEGGR
jgi:methyl-accepting chemotaxis protein